MSRNHETPWYDQRSLAGFRWQEKLIIHTAEQIVAHTWRELNHPIDQVFRELLAREAELDIVILRHQDLQLPATD